MEKEQVRLHIMSHRQCWSQPYREKYQYPEKGEHKSLSPRKFPEINTEVKLEDGEALKITDAMASLNEADSAE